MATRMEKYASKSNARNSRSNRNKNLYSEIYTYDNYSNIEGVADIKNNNQVDITKVKELLEARDSYQSKRKYRRQSEDNTEEIKVKKRFPELEEKNYNLKEVLDQARENKKPDDKDRVLRNTQYNILKNIDLKKELQQEKEETAEEDLKEMIQTITNTSMINKTQEYTSTGLFDHLKDEDTKVGELDNIKELIDENKVKTRSVGDQNNVTNYDRSFFTSSLKLNKTDFIDFGGSKKSKIISIIIIVILVIVALVSAVILAKKMFF